MRDFDYLDLGATLYVPILHRNLPQILNRQKYPFLRSIVICLEDSTAEEHVAEGMARLATLLQAYTPTDLIVFIRPRNPQSLASILTMPGIGRIDGFALAKFGPEAQAYLALMQAHPTFRFMPILETDVVFDPEGLRALAQMLQQYRERIGVIRVGGEDILGRLGMLRNCHRTLYEILPLYLVLSQIIMIFRPLGFEIAAPVVSCFGDPDMLWRELEGDVEHRLLNKTCIHPGQVATIHRAYAVTHADLSAAQAILDDQRAVLGTGSRMLEKAPHTAWAENVLRRHTKYGER